MRFINQLGFDIVHGCQLQCVGCPNSTLKPKIKILLGTKRFQMMKNLDKNRIDMPICNQCEF